MQGLDIDKVRDAQIKLGGLARADLPYTFYHDETNNIKKLHIEGGALNIAQPKVFVLGGIVHSGAPRPIDIAQLRADLRIQGSAREIKLKHIAKGNFLEVLASEKLTKFLQWLSVGDLLLHYLELDPLFWSVVDIVDSILHARPELGQAAFYHLQIKSDLVQALRTDLPATVRLFGLYGYPNVQPGQREAFIKDLLTLLEQNEQVLDEFNYNMLKGVIQAGRRVDELAFIEDNVSHVLIDEFSSFYRGRVILFKPSTHVFDNEETIRESLATVPLITGGSPFVNYRFADSEHEAGIQVSDIVVGVLGKMHSYFTETGAEGVTIDRDALSGSALTNALLLRDLISASHNENIALQQHLASHYDRDKADRFLRFEDGEYA